MYRNGTQEYQEFIINGVKKKERNFQLLYKYQTVQDYTYNSLSKNLIKYSRYGELNDPFDMMPRMKESDWEPTYGKAWELKEILKEEIGQSYNLPSDIMDRIEWIEKNKGRKLTKLASFVADFKDYPVLDLLRKIEDSDNWMFQLLGYAGQAVKFFTENSGIFCTTYDPTNILMWGYYANGFDGFCIGYGTILGATPNDFFPVNYKSRFKPPSLLDCSLDPMSSVMRLNCTKPSKWKHEKELRSFHGDFTTDNGFVIESRYPIMKLILGYKLDNAIKDKLISCVNTDYCSILEAVPILVRGYPKVAFTRLDDDNGSRQISIGDFNHMI